jgi:hypothetical protein
MKDDASSFPLLKDKSGGSDEERALYECNGRPPLSPRELISSNLGRNILTLVISGCLCYLFIYLWIGAGHIDDARKPLRFTSDGTFQISIFEDLHFGESMYDQRQDTCVDGITVRRCVGAMGPTTRYLVYVCPEPNPRCRIATTGGPQRRPHHW